MQITPEQCLVEAANMALELRLKDRALAQYEEEIRGLRARVAELEGHAEHAPQVPGTGHKPDDTGEAARASAQTPI